MLRKGKDYSLQVNNAQPGFVSGFVGVRTAGHVTSELVPFQIAVCQAPIIKWNQKPIPIKQVYNKDDNDGKHNITSDTWSSIFEFNKCPSCKPKV